LLLLLSLDRKMHRPPTRRNATRLSSSPTSAVARTAEDPPRCVALFLYAFVDHVVVVVVVIVAFRIREGFRGIIIFAVVIVASASAFRRAFRRRDGRVLGAVAVAVAVVVPASAASAAVAASCGSGGALGEP
jgi:hypothetical protein